MFANFGTRAAFERREKCPSEEHLLIYSHSLIQLAVCVANVTDSARVSMFERKKHQLRVELPNRVLPNMMTCRGTYSTMMKFKGT